MCQLKSKTWETIEKIKIDLSFKSSSFRVKTLRSDLQLIGSGLRPGLSSQPTDRRPLLLPQAPLCCPSKVQFSDPLINQPPFSPVQEMKGWVEPKASTSLDMSPLSFHLLSSFLSSRHINLWSWSSPPNSFGMYIFVSWFFSFVSFIWFDFSLIQFSLPLWLFTCWTAFCRKDSNEAAFFQLTDEEKSTFLDTICFFSNEWIHRMDTRLLRSDKRWTGGICSTYLNAENSPEK